MLCQLDLNKTFSERLKEQRATTTPRGKLSVSELVKIKRTAERERTTLNGRGVYGNVAERKRRGSSDAVEKVELTCNDRGKGESACHWRKDTTR